MAARFISTETTARGSAPLAASGTALIPHLAPLASLASAALIESIDDAAQPSSEPQPIRGLTDAGTFIIHDGTEYQVRTVKIVQRSMLVIRPNEIVPVKVVKAAKKIAYFDDGGAVPTGELIVLGDPVKTALPVKTAANSGDTVSKVSDEEAAASKPVTAQKTARSKATSKAEKLIKSKERVQAHGEVFTPAWVVKMMLDIDGVKEKAVNVDATFLEPAAGDGNFLIEILHRKLSAAMLMASSIETYEHAAIRAISSIYGVEILHDNHADCCENVLKVFTEHYDIVAEFYQQPRKQLIEDVAKHLVSKNIIHGNFLTEIREDNGRAIEIYEWDFYCHPKNGELLIGWDIHQLAFLDFRESKFDNHMPLAEMLNSAAKSEGK